MRKHAKALGFIVPCILLAIGTVVGTVYATYPDHHIGGGVWMHTWGSVWGPNAVLLNPDGEVYYQGWIPEMNDEGFLFVDTFMSGVGYDEYGGDRRAELFAVKTTSGAEAWIRSSAGAQVKALDDGDVIVTLGN